jgi:hypothetical protein
MTTLQTKCILIYLLYLKKTKYALLDLMIKKLYLSVTLSLSLCLSRISLSWTVVQLLQNDMVRGEKK